MGWPELFVFVRHGESAGNVLSPDERAAFEQPTHKYPLTERGRQQSALTGAYLKDLYGDFDVVWSSYYVRARETAAILVPGRKVWEDARLAEGQRGRFHTMSKAEIEQHMPWELRAKEREGSYHYRPPGGENWPDIEQRIHSFLGTLARDGDGKRVLVVGHGHWLILFQKLVEHFSIEEAVRRYQAGAAPNASVTVYEGRPRTWWKPWKRDALTLTSQHVTPWRGQIEENPLTVAAPA